MSHNFLENIDEYINDFLYGKDEPEIFEENTYENDIPLSTETDLEILYITPDDKKIYEIRESIDVKKLRLKVIEKWIVPNDTCNIPILLNIDSNLFYGDFMERIKIPKKCINIILKTIDEKKVITRKIINSLRIYKNILLYRRGMIKYTFFLEEHYKILKGIFTKFYMSDSDICILIDEILTTTDKMILSCGNYSICTNYLSCGYLPLDKPNFIHALDGYYSSMNIKPFDFNMLSLNVTTPEICIRSIIDVIISKLKNSNYIYVKKFEEKNETNNWAFYYLQNIECNIEKKLDNPIFNRFWKLDCRMDKIVSVCIDSLDKYTTLLFIKKYTQIFGDRIKREFIFDGQIRAVFEDLNILYTNIRLISHKKTLCKELRKRFKINVYNPTINDKFDRQIDDSFIKDEYGNYTLEEAMETENKKMRLIFQDP